MRGERAPQFFSFPSSCFSVAPLKRRSPNDAAVTTALARTKKYVVSGQDNNGTDIAVNVPIIRNVAGGKLNVGTTGSDGKKILFEGSTPVTFGIRAIRLGFADEGRITDFTSAALLPKSVQHRPPERPRSGREEVM